MKKPHVKTTGAFGKSQWHRDAKIKDDNEFIGVEATAQFFDDMDQRHYPSDHPLLAITAAMLAAIAGALIMLIIIG